MSGSSIVTRTLVFLNVLAFVWEAVVTHGGILTGNINQTVADFTLIPIAVLQYHQWYRLVTMAFLHGSIVHIAVNMISLWALGRFIELVLGPARMLVLYVISMIGASEAVVYLAPSNVATLGASGAIFGLFGALFAIGLKLGGQPGMALVRSNIGILVFNLVLTFTPALNISWQGHIGGLVTGFIVGLLLYSPPRRVRADVVDASTGQPLETEYEAPPS